MKYEKIKVDESKGVLAITLNNPVKKNAFEPQMIEELKDCFQRAKSHKLSCVTLTGEGDTFSAGADLNWMKGTLNYSQEENIQDAENLYELFELMDTFPVPVIACVQRYVLGGGVGLISACDYVIAVEGTQFSFSEVKMGLIPACIGPFVLKKLGESWARAMFLSAERFDVTKANVMGLIHETAPDMEAGLEQLNKKVTQISSCSNEALATAKKFLRNLKGQSPEQQKTLAVETLANIRVTDSAQEGVRAFLEKRKPNWSQDGK